MPDLNPRVWGIHAGKTGDAESLFKKGYVALGWAKIGDLSSLPKNRETYKKLYAETFPESKPGAIPTSAGQLFRFVNELEEGDLVVFRSKQEPVIRIGRIIGPYSYDPRIESGYPQLRRVDWLSSISPAQVTQGALYELGSALSFFQISTYADEWLAILSGNHSLAAADGARGRTNGDTEEDPTIGITAESIEELTRDYVLKRLFQELKGHPFASFVAHLLGTMGYRTRVSPPGADGGVDIIAHRDELGFEPPIVKVQVKSTQGNVGQPEVSALLGTLSSGEYGLVVSLGGFTVQARNFAKNKGNLRLVDGIELVDLVFGSYEQFDSRYKGLLPLKRVYVPNLLDQND